MAVISAHIPAISYAMWDYIQAKSGCQLSYIIWYNPLCSCVQDIEVVNTRVIYTKFDIIYIFSSWSCDVRSSPYQYNRCIHKLQNGAFQYQIKRLIMGCRMFSKQQSFLFRIVQLFWRLFLHQCVGCFVTAFVTADTTNNESFATNYRRLVSSVPTVRTIVVFFSLHERHGVSNQWW